MGEKPRTEDDVLLENIKRAARYIAQNRRKGFPDDLISNRLEEAGYSEEMVNEAMLFLKVYRIKSHISLIIISVCVLAAITALLKIFNIF